MKGFDFVETVSGGADIKFADDNRVIEVGQAMYAQAASSLLEAVGDGYYYRWVLSIPFFISCIRQQNPLTVLSKIILRKVKQFNLPPPKK